MEQLKLVIKILYNSIKKEYPSMSLEVAPKKLFNLNKCLEVKIITGFDHRKTD